MQHSPNQNKHMPNRMIQIIIPHKERYTNRIHHTTRSKNPHCLDWQRLHQVWKTDYSTPCTTKVHCQGEFRLVFPSPECCLRNNTTASTGVNEPQQFGILMLLKGYIEQWTVRSTNQHVNRTPIKHPKDETGACQCKEGMV